MEGFLKLSTAVNITVLMIDSSDHITGKTGLAAGLTIYATKAAGTPATITPTVAELDATNVKGLYSLALTTTHTNTLGEFQLHITATGADPADYKWQVSTYLPGEAATLQADQAVNVTKVNGTSQTARDLGASVLLSAGTGTGQLDFTSGVVKANATQWLGTAVTAATAGIPDVNTKNYNNVAAATDANNLPKVDVEDWKAGVVPATITTGVPLVEWTPSPAELTGTATASGTNTITLATAASTTAHFYNGMIILITSGTGKGQTRIIQEYSTGRVATVSPAWTTVPASNATYIVFPIGMADLETLLCSNSGSGAGVSADLATGVLQVDVVQWSGGFVAFDGVSGLPEVQTRNNFDKTGYALTSAEQNSVADAFLARSLGTEGYAAKGAVPTVQQAMFMLLQNMQEMAISSTTLTIKKIDGTTTAMTYTLDSSTAPTSRTRAT